MKKQIRELVDAHLDELAGLDRLWRPLHIVRHVEERFEFVLPGGDFGDRTQWAAIQFYRHCSHATVRAIVADAIRKRADPSRTADDQLVFEGFPRVQAYYMVDRGGEWQGVPVLQLQPAERSAKVLELRCQAHALTEHADQLELFFDTYGRLAG